MKKKKIKKGILLLSMVMVIISTVLPVTSNATEYTTGDVLYEIYNGDSTVGQEAFPYIHQRAHMIRTVKFITIQVYENGETTFPISQYVFSDTLINFYFTEPAGFPSLTISDGGDQIIYRPSRGTDITPYKITIYEIIGFEPTTTPSPVPTATPSPKPTATPTPKPTATPSPKPTPTPSPKPTASPSPKPTASPSPTPIPTATPEPDERVKNILDETGKGIGTILTWVGDLWEGITTGDMKAILPIFAIFVIIPTILLVIKIIKKNTWGK